MYCNQNNFYYADILILMIFNIKYIYFNILFFNFQIVENVE